MSGSSDYQIIETDQEPDFVLYGVHFGRGNHYRPPEGPIEFRHSSVKVERWQIVGDSLKTLDTSQFYSGESYLVRWTYRTETVDATKEATGGAKDDHLYFYWKGDDAVKGFSPLPDDLQEENPAVERVPQWSEPPIFLRLFDGSFVVHSGAQDKPKYPHPRLYILRGEIESEVHFFEVPCCWSSLRSRTSFLMHRGEGQNLLIWHGNRSPAQSRAAIKLGVGKVFGSNFDEIAEGAENPPARSLSCTPKLFYMSNSFGRLMAIKVENAHRSSHVTPFPFLQSHLHSAEQPALFLLDDGDEIWIWQGQGEETEAFRGECAAARSMAARYAEEKGGNPEIRVVSAGLEPLVFANLFPVWR